MSRKHQRRGPQQVASEKKSDRWWWYEEGRGLRLFFDPPLGFQVCIPWRYIRGALKRKDKKP